MAKHFGKTAFKEPAGKKLDLNPFAKDHAPSKGKGDQDGDWSWGSKSSNEDNDGFWGAKKGGFDWLPDSKKGGDDWGFDFKPAKGGNDWGFDFKPSKGGNDWGFDFNPSKGGNDWGFGNGKGGCDPFSFLKGFLVKDTTPLSVTTGGNADAVGQSTFADGKIDSKLTDKGLISFACGETSFTAESASPEGEIAYAAADSFADITGADFIFLLTYNTTGQSEDGSASYASSITKYVAIDFELFDFAGGPKVFNKTITSETDDFDAALEGNLASHFFDLLAEGDDTYTGLDFSVLAIEDQLSSVFALAEASLG